MEDIYVKCCRCKNKHWHSERKNGKQDKYGLTPLVCPRCGAQSYYKLEAPAEPQQEAGDSIHGDTK